MKLAVIYDSKTGNTKQAAEWIAEGMRGTSGIETGTFSIGDVDEQFVKEAKGVVIGSPSYAAAMTPDLHAWLLGNGGKLGFGGKLGGAFATEQFTHGGAGKVIQDILTIELVNGMLCYSSGGACGDPYIHLGPVGVNDNKEKHNGMEKYKDYFVLFGKRFADKAAEIF
ncbi:MAG: flavodoxin domain-containing protein [Lachnospiraceae bacterium]|nr:flavodoxin domain-containing protein [Lachnospiraceae bacterium]